MNISLRHAVALAIAAVSGTAYAQDHSDISAQTLETVLITAKRADRVSKGATGLDLDIADTPQSISVVTREQMDNFGTDNINDALRLATGINVEEWETNRTNYMARGFEIKNTQVDGVGLPNDWGIVTGAIDSFGYEKVEIIRGANGLLTGVGNSAGTINYVRKRPTNVTQGSIEASGGSFDQRRLEADYSTPFTADGKWAGRLAFASEEQDSWVRDLNNDRTFVYGVIDGQLGERSTLTVGYSYQEANTDQSMWGALVLAYSDGTQAEFGRGASTSVDWAFWDTRNTNAFAEYTFKMTDAWDFKLTYNYRKYEDTSKLFFAYSFVGIDRDTGLGLLGWPSYWMTDDESNLLEGSLNGTFELFGREHEAMVGVSYGAGKHKQHNREADPGDPSWGDLPAFPYAGNAIAEPEWGTLAYYGTTDQTLKRGFGATRLSVTDKLRTIVGFNYAEYHRDGDQTGVPFDQTDSEFSPYAGLTYQLFDQVMLYGSYSDIYQPQDQNDITGRYLDPSKGVNYEVGLKAQWLDRRLLTTVALFKAKQENLATYVGINDNDQYYYEGVDVDSKGIELEVVGRLGQSVDLVVGYTTLKLQGASGQDIYEWVPRHTANVALSARLPSFTALSFGISGRWQSETAKLDEYTNFVVHQDSYATLNAFARWEVTQKLHVRANVFNLSDEKYITSLYQIGYYGAPRSYELGLGYKF